MAGLKSATLWIIIFLAVILIALHLSEKQKPQEIGIVTLHELAKANKIKSAVDKGGRIEGTYWDENSQEQSFVSEYLEGQSEEILRWMVASNVDYSPKPQSTVFQQLLFSLLLPIVLFIGLCCCLCARFKAAGTRRCHSADHERN